MTWNYNSVTWNIYSKTWNIKFYGKNLEIC